MTFEPLYGAYSHAWSPDGRWLALIREVEVEDAGICGGLPEDGCVAVELWIANAADKRAKMILSIVEGEAAWGIDWRRG